MKTRLLSLWETIRTSLWFVPSAMVIIYSGIALILTRYESVLPSAFEVLFYSGSAEGARLLLSTVAGSMMTIVSITFSITIVALTLTISQFGPRLLRNFMADRGNQIVLGAFIATFVYCLLVLKEIQTTDGTIHIPRLAVSVGLVLALVNLGILIYFLHHISTSIHATNVINSVFKDLENRIVQFFEQPDDTSQTNSLTERDLPDFENAMHVNSGASGYLKAIDVANMLEFAEQHNLVIQMQYRPGDYVFKSTPLAAVIVDTDPDSNMADKIASFFLLGSSRSPEQDIEFAIHQLVEVAVRALSPGINDPYTAIGCIDRLGDIICRLSSLNFPPRYRYDKDGTLRLVMDVLTYDGILDAAFNQIRQYTGDSVAVKIRMLETLKVIAGAIENKDHFSSIKRHAGMIYRSSKTEIEEQEDLKDIENRYEAVIREIEVKKN